MTSLKAHPFLRFTFPLHHPNPSSAYHPLPPLPPPPATHTHTHTQTQTHHSGVFFKLIPFHITLSLSLSYPFPTECIRATRLLKPSKQTVCLRDNTTDHKWTSSASATSVSKLVSTAATSHQLQGSSATTTGRSS